MTFDQLVSLILGVGSVIVLFLLGAAFWYAFTPALNEVDETAKSYFETFEKEIEDIDDDKVGEFFMWYIGDNSTGYYLVYFGMGYNVNYTKTIWTRQYHGGLWKYLLPEDSIFQFHSLGNNKNRICVCSVTGNEEEGYESNCKHCEDLNYPVEFSEKDDIWYIESGKVIKMELMEDKYVFSEI